MSAYFLQGLALGFAGGMTPGPLLALVLSVSLRSGFRNGALVGVAPLITDLPIVVLCIGVVTQLPADALRALSLAGAAVLVWSAYEAARDGFTVSLAQLRSNATQATTAARDLRQGVLVNLLNPNPWLFWLGVGGPLLVQAWQAGPLSAAAFLVPFYALLVGGKVALAWGIGMQRARMSDVGYRALLLGCAALLLLLAASLVMRAIS